MTKLPKITLFDNPGNEELKEYLLLLERALSRTLDDIGEATGISVTERLSSEYNLSAIETLKEGIIRTAEEIKSVRDSINLTLQNDYVAKSEAEIFAENALQSIELDGKGITQYFKEISLLAERVGKAEEDLSGASDTAAELELKVSEINAYIRTGRLESGVYGIEIGNFSDSGITPYKVRLSENRLSFYIGNVEAAYFSDNSMVISDASVLNVLNLGDCMLLPDDGICFVCKK